MRATLDYVGGALVLAVFALPVALWVMRRD
jgi:hypothetical protein